MDSAIFILWPEPGDESSSRSPRQFDRGRSKRCEGFEWNRVQLGYVTKLAGATGAVIWTQGNSSAGVYYFVTGVAADPSGNVVVVGDFRGTGNNSGTTYMISKLSGTDGTIQWQQSPVTYSRYGYQNLIYTQVSLDSQGD